MKELKKKLEKARKHELKRRSLAKAITWRTIATLTTMTLVFMHTKQWSITLAVGGLDVISKLVFYFAHERIWAMIDWGRWKSK